MKLQVKQSGGEGELTVPSQKEFLVLFNRGVIGKDDLVLRAGKWVPVAELPWIRGMAVDRKTDNKRLFWITLAMMVLGLVLVIFIQSRAHTRVKPWEVHAVPAR
jgi:hypothetical protein